MKLDDLLAKLGLFIMLLASASGQNAAAEPKEALKIEDHCDLPGPDFRRESVANKEQCAALCQSDAECQAFVFASGWNKCFLKKGQLKKSKIAFYSGAVVASPSEARSVETPQLDRDITSHDMRREDGVKNAEQCRIACQAEAKCLAYTFIAGYDSCWIKDKTKPAIEKIFYCGLK